MPRLRKERARIYEGTLSSISALPVAWRAGAAHTPSAKPGLAGLRMIAVVFRHSDGLPPVVQAAGRPSRVNVRQATAAAAYAKSPSSNSSRFGSR